MKNYFMIPVVCSIFVILAISGCETGNEPKLFEYSNSGCLSDSDNIANSAYDKNYAPCSGPESLETTVENNTLHVIHKNSVHNCCLDEIKIALEADGNILKVKEDPVESAPCDCECCYNVESTIIDLSPGIYVLEYCTRQCFEKYIVVL